jgi:hypothetical protein
MHDFLQGLVNLLVDTDNNVLKFVIVLRKAQFIGNFLFKTEFTMATLLFLSKLSGVVSKFVEIELDNKIKNIAIYCFNVSKRSTLCIDKLVNYSNQRNQMKVVFLRQSEYAVP